MGHHRVPESCGRRAAEFGQNPGYHGRRHRGRGVPFGLVASRGCMQPPEWIRRSRFWMIQIDDDMVGPQLVPKMQKKTVGRSRSEMQLRSERG